jgi:septal ring factor EnvC (AmiA/AmiB activator)
MPESVEAAYAAGQGEFEVKYIGPLARAQKVDSVRAIQEWSAFMAQMAELNPEILDVMDFDQIAKELAKLSNVPQELMKKANEVKKLRAKRQEQQQAMMEAEQNQMNAAAAKDASAAEQQQQEAV